MKATNAATDRCRSRSPAKRIWFISNRILMLRSLASAIHIVERHGVTLAICKGNHSPRHVWRHILPLHFVVTDVPLRDINSNCKGSLRKTKPVSNQLNVVAHVEHTSGASWCSQ